MFKGKKDQEGQKYVVPTSPNLSTVSYAIAAEDGGYVIKKFTIENGYVTETVVFPADVFAITMSQLMTLIRTQLEI